MKEQLYIHADNSYLSLQEVIEEKKYHRIFLVCGRAIEHMELKELLDDYRGVVTSFKGFTPNPSYEEIMEGVKAFEKGFFDCIIAVGGGSAIDVAKCIKYYANDALGIDFIAVPTTAGTGSESTEFAVLYVDGEKKSVSHRQCMPDVVVLDGRALETLSDYQRKTTMLDALSHSVESFWSIHSNAESKYKSELALRQILENYKGYIDNDKSANRNMLLAANMAGQAINITKTTVAHAMSYKMTSLYGIAHGHAVGICLLPVWKYMKNHTEKCTDKRGIDYLIKTFCDLDEIWRDYNYSNAIEGYKCILRELELPGVSGKTEDIEVLVNAINVERLSNSPIFWDRKILEMIYLDTITVEG